MLTTDYGYATEFRSWSQISRPMDGKARRNLVQRIHAADPRGGCCVRITALRPEFTPPAFSAS